MDTIDGLALQELREYCEALLDDPEYVSDCPQGAARARLIIALMDERDERIDAAAAPQDAPPDADVLHALMDCDDSARLIGGLVRDDADAAEVRRCFLGTVRYALERFATPQSTPAPKPEGLRGAVQGVMREAERRIAELSSIEAAEGTLNFTERGEKARARRSELSHFYELMLATGVCRARSAQEPEGLRSAALSMRACADGEDALAAQLVERAGIMRAAADDIDALLARPDAAEGVEGKCYSELQNLPNEVPTSWRDPLLTALPSDLSKCTPRHIEALLRGIQDRQRAVVRAVLASDDGEQADG